MASLEGIISLGPWGGSGGEQWRFRGSNGITEIIINFDSNIKAISFKDDKGYISGTFGGNNPTDLGKQEKIQIDWPSEYFTTISGTVGTYIGRTVITSLTFTTNIKSYGPFGKATGDEFSIPIAGGVVVGFHGRSANYIDAIGILVQPVDSDGSISLGPWGGQGGRTYSFNVSNWIKEITIYDGGIIDAIAFKDANGHNCGQFGSYTGATKNTIDINGPSEYLTSIAGTYGVKAHNVNTPVITSLSLITNLTTYGPFGTASSTSFSIPIEGAVVNGFHGRSAYCIDAIGIFVKPKSTL